MIKRIVLTGGPGSGKTSVLEKIDQVFTAQGYKVIIIDETASYLINHGVKPFGDGAVDLVDFQELVMRMQLAKEEVFDRAVEMLPNDKVIIVYDRGTIDNRAYINEEEFEEVLTRLNHVKDIAELMNKYDLVINLVSREDFYTTENNKARSEDVTSALELGKKTLKVWLGHPKVKIVLPKDELDYKIKEVLNEINKILNLKQVKRQEKYLVDLKNSDIDYIKNNGSKVEIEQVYLQSNPDVEKRIRKVKMGNSYAYYMSVYKIMEDGTKVIVSEKQIDSKVYDSLMEFKDDKYRIVHKKRYYFSYKGEYFYLDIFADDNDLGILEINVSDDEEVLIPDFVSVIDRVTKDSKYSNKSMALIKPVVKKVLQND